MNNKNRLNGLWIALLALLHTACGVPFLGSVTEKKTAPLSYASSQDTTNTAGTTWKLFFTDPFLTALIDTGLRNNQELNIVLQEINLAKNEVKARKGAYLPFVGPGAGIGVEKVGRYTSQGASDANDEVLPGRRFPDPLPNYLVGVNASWEVDIWKKLRNANKSALKRYLSSIEGKNFLVTNLVSEIANAYYELMALDNQVEILRQNIEIQQNVLAIVKLEKASARVTELAVRRFEAEVLKNQSHQFYLAQQITETENRINFLVGRFPQPVLRNSPTFNTLVAATVQAGIPAQLLANRPDIRQAEQELAASKLDVKSAKANFYPSLFITAGLGYQAFNPEYLLRSPESLLFSLTGQLFGPLVNRNAIKANYLSANARQIQAVYHLQQTILRAHIEVVNQLANIGNLEKSYDLKTQQVQALVQSIDISTNLFRSARADYMEVLLTQRDALESKFELTETKRQQMNAMVNIYRALGGGWK
jgi:outer membrane protein, multidrug efflux system